MRHYYRIVFNLLFLLVSFAVIGPNLISAKDDFLYVAGILYIVLVVPTVLYYLNEKTVKSYIESLKKEKKRRSEIEDEKS